MKKVFVNSLYYMLASFLPTFVGFIMLPIFSRYLTPADYGVVALVLTFNSFLPLIMTLQIHQSISRFYFDYVKCRDSLRTFISTNLVITLLVSVTMTGALLIFHKPIISTVFPNTIGYDSLFVLGILSSFVMVFVNTFINIIRVQQKAKLFFQLSVGLFVLSLGISIVEIVVLERGAYGIVEATFLTSVMSFFAYLFIVKEFFTFSLDFKVMREPLKYSLPLIPHSLASLIFLYSDRIILERYVGLGAIGIYMFSDKLSRLFKTVERRFNTAFIPSFNEMAIESKENARKMTQDVSIIVLFGLSLIIVAVSLFSVEIMDLIFDDRYFDAWLMFPLLASVNVLRALFSFTTAGLFFEKRTLIISIITIVSAVVNIVINLLYIPKYGVIVAVYSTLASVVVSYLLAELLSFKIYPLQLSKIKNTLVLAYLFAGIYISSVINAGYPSLGVSQYLIKCMMLLLGLGVGYKLGLFDIARVKSLLKRTK